MQNIDIFYEHQKLYYNKLIQMKSPFKSLICLPTGGGKTKLAVDYVSINCLQFGLKVLWVAHSQFLLNQAYAVFSNSGYKENEMICIHSQASSCSNILPTHKIVIASFQSLIMNKNKWEKIIGDEAVVVIDEAHHLAAPTYMDCLSDYTDGKTTLGLTATPVRGKSEENNILYRFFSTDLGIRVHMAKLFENKILVKPLFEDVYYTFDNKTINTLDDLTNELSKSANYNELILNQYSSNELEYSKTVIFALNKEHAVQLYATFKSKYPERTYCVYSGLSNRNEEFEGFKNSKNGILININILNEGVDIPDIKSIFLTKPLNSRIAVTQIIGRALRKSKGKDHANIVNFAVSNVGKKLMLVTPKLSYRIYESEWAEDNKEVDDLTACEIHMSKIAEDLENIIKNHAVCAFSTIFVVGYYSVLGNDEISDLPFPVTFNEYMKIERYIKNQSSKDTFPHNLFLSDGCNIFKNAIDNNYNIIFKSYDTELLSLIEVLNIQIRELNKKIIEHNLTLKQEKKEISQLYDNLNIDIKYYLNNVSANSFKTFLLLVRNELTYLRRQSHE